VHRPPRDTPRTAADTDLTNPQLRRGGDPNGTAARPTPLQAAEANHLRRTGRNLPAAMTADAGSSDIIRPALAVLPEELCHLIADAIGDGDLDAALTYYEPGAILAANAAAPAVGLDAIRQVLAGAVEAKLAYEVHVQRSLIVGEIALLAGRWSMRGTGRDGMPSAESGVVSSMARRGPDRAWRVVAENLTLDAAPAVAVTDSRSVG
jgi:ketosteroid isomerase-like protein